MSTGAKRSPAHLKQGLGDSKGETKSGFLLRDDLRMSASSMETSTRSWQRESCPTALGEPATWPPEGPERAAMAMGPDAEAVAEMARNRALDWRKKP